MPSDGTDLSTVTDRVIAPYSIGLKSVIPALLHEQSTVASTNSSFYTVQRIWLNSAEWVIAPLSLTISGLSLRASAVMGTTRLEVAGTISEALGRQLKAAGCFTEIISWRTRYFIPVNEMSAPGVIEQVMSLTV